MTNAELDRRGFLKAAVAGATLAAWPRWSFGEEAPNRTGKRPPNIIFILADDLSMAALKCYGADRNQGPTSTIDALADGGVRFTRCHTVPVCGPSRCQFLTGNYPFRTGFVSNSGRIKIWATPEKFPAIAACLKEAGYATGMVGKWHHLKPGPAGWGFDEHLQSPAVAGVYWISPNGAYTVNGRKVSPKERVFFPEVMHDFAEDFITRHQQHPFFLYYPMHYPHGGEGLNETPDKTTPLATMDRMVGKTVAVLERLKLRQDTLLIFASDNGGGHDTIGGRKVLGGKFGLQEGGCTVPFIANWPGVVPAGKVNTELVDFADMLPTFVELAGGKLPAGKTLDGVSIAAQLRGEKGNPKGWAFAQIDNRWFVRDDRWKLTDAGELLDVSDGLFVEKPVRPGAEPEARKCLDAIAEHLGVREAVKAHPEWAKTTDKKPGEKKPERERVADDKKERADGEQ